MDGSTERDGWRVGLQRLRLTAGINTSLGGGEFVFRLGEIRVQKQAQSGGEMKRQAGGARLTDFFAGEAEHSSSTSTPLF